MKEAKQVGDEMLFDAIEQDISQKDLFVKKMVKQIDDMQNQINKLDDFAKILDFVLEMLPFIHAVGQHKEPVSINDSQVRPTQVSEFLLDENERVFEQISFAKIAL